MGEGWVWFVVIGKWCQSRALVILGEEIKRDTNTWIAFASVGRDAWEVEIVLERYESAGECRVGMKWCCSLVGISI